MSRPAISQDETLNTLQFYVKSYNDLRQEADKSLQQLWSRLNVLSKRVEEIGKSIELIQRYSYQYNVRSSVSLKERQVSQPPTQLYYVLASFKLQELKSLFQISILLIVLPQETPFLARDQSFASSQEGLRKRRS